MLHIVDLSRSEQLSATPPHETYPNRIGDDTLAVVRQVSTYELLNIFRWRSNVDLGFRCDRVAQLSASFYYTTLRVFATHVVCLVIYASGTCCYFSDILPTR